MKTYYSAQDDSSIIKDKDGRVIKWLDKSGNENHLRSVQIPTIIQRIKMTCSNHGFTSGNLIKRTDKSYWNIDYYYKHFNEVMIFLIIITSIYEGRIVLSIGCFIWLLIEYKKNYDGPLWVCGESTPSELILKIPNIWVRIKRLWKRITNF